MLRAAGGIAHTEITERVRKATDLCGLHLGASEDIPANAIALSIDEKSQIQTPDRTVPILPMQPGPIERRSHDYCRHDATTLIAALEIATGKVTATLKTRHRNQEFLAYLKHVDHTYRDAIEPGTGQRFELHLVMDDYAAHKHREVRAWMESPHLRVHFTPTHASWMNLVEV